MKKNNTVKKILSAALSLSVMLSLAACGGEKAPAGTQSSAPDTKTGAPNCDAADLASGIDQEKVKYYVQQAHSDI